MLWQFLPASHGAEWGADIIYPTDAALVTMLANHAAVMNIKGLGVDDHVNPTVSITAPTPGSTINTAGFTMTGSASDDQMVTRVLVRINGGGWQTAIGTAKATIAWSMSLGVLKQGANVLEAQAFDWGNNASTIARVEINFVSPPTAPLVLYDDSIRSPWSQSSWGATVNLNNTTPVYAGSRSVRVDQSAWNFFRVYNPNGTSPGLYKSLDFAIYGTGIDLNVQLNNANGSAPALYHLTNLSANQWNVVSIPMSTLDPEGDPFYFVTFQEGAGKSATYYIDDIKLVP